MNSEKKRKLQISGTVVGLIVILFSYTHCVFEQKTGTNKRVTTSTEPSTNTNNNNTTGDPADIPDPGGDTSVPVNPVVLEEVDVGVKNYEQINETMATVTGVDPDNSNIRNTFSDLQTQLPSTNDVKSFLAANQVAVIKLAAEYCDRLVESGSLRSSLWPTINFGQSPNQQLGDANRNLIINQTLDRFWGASVDMTSRTSSFTELKTLMADLLVGENLGSSATTRKIVKGVCTAALSSASVILL